MVPRVLTGGPLRACLPVAYLSWKTAPLPLSQARKEPTATSGSSVSSTTASNLSLEEKDEDGNGPLNLSLLASVCDNIFFASSAGVWKSIFPKSSPVFEYRRAQHWKGSLVEPLCPRAACIYRLSKFPPFTDYGDILVTCEQEK